MVDHRDLVQMLDPIRAVIPGDDQPQREAVEPGQILPVHRVSEHDLAIASVIEIERLHKVGRFRQRRPVEPVEGDLPASGLNAGAVEDGLERNPAPAGIAHGAMPKLSAGDAGLDESAAVSRALMDGDQFDRLEAGFKIGQ